MPEVTREAQHLEFLTLRTKQSPSQSQRTCHAHHHRGQRKDGQDHTHADGALREKPGKQVSFSISQYVQEIRPSVIPTLFLTLKINL